MQLMSTNVMLAVVAGVTMLGLQACFEPAGGYANRSGYRYGQPGYQSGYQYSQPQYSPQQYGQYGQYRSYGYAQLPPNPRYGYTMSGQHPQYRQNGQDASQHTICDSGGNNCLVCDADKDRCRRQASDR